jgi:putative membrane protein
MFIDYITLMLINMVAGLVLLAGFVYQGAVHSNAKQWIPGFGVAGAIALVTGLHMTFTWPIGGSYNIAFGETSILFGILFVGTSIALAMGWDLLSLGIYAFFAGLAAVVIGVRLINLELTKLPLLSGLGFILTGLGGLAATPTLLYFKLNRTWRILGTVILLAAAFIWAFTGYFAYWNHLEGFQKWVPQPLRS